MYSLIFQRLTPKLEGNLKGMDKYEEVEKYRDGIELAEMIRNICYLQDDDKQDIMDVLETDKQVYMFYQENYQSNV